MQRCRGEGAEVLWLSEVQCYRVAKAGVQRCSCRGAEVQRWCRGGAEVVQSSGPEVQWCSGGAEVQWCSGVERYRDAEVQVQ